MRNDTQLPVPVSVRCSAGLGPASVVGPEPYRPSNGSEGQWFEAKFCAGCAKWRGENCGINLRAHAYELEDAKYPKQWVRLHGNEYCTAFRPKGAPPDTRRGQRLAPGQSELFGKP